jgi:diguanylate cyclase (GGDEF)-like protein/PAS domain S-box-containing protein
MSYTKINDLCYLAVRSLSDGVIITDTDGRVVFLNKTAEDITGWETSLAIGQSLDDVFAVIHEQDKTRYIVPVREIIENNDTYIKLPDYLLLTNGCRYEGVLISGKCNSYTDEEGNTLGVVLVFYDAALQKQRENEIRYYSFYDSLTGLYNRSFLEEELKRLDTDRMLPLSLIWGDANGLKLVNDVFGHSEGDLLLKRMAGILKEVCRREDIIARVGGDEFVILLPNVSYDESLSIINRIQERCKSADPYPIRISISLGSATKEYPHVNIKHVSKLAEERMYTNKLIEGREFRNEVIVSVHQSLEEHAGETQAHCNRLKELSLKLGRRIGIGEYELSQLEQLSMIHDIGKIAVPKHILDKPGPLGVEEWRIMRKHSEKGYRIAAYSPELAFLADAILSHHERWDGKGYPQG